MGEPGSPSSSLVLALVALSFIVTLTETTEGFTRSTISAKPTGCAALDTVLLTPALAAPPIISKRPDEELKPYIASPVTIDAINATFRAENRECFCSRSEEETG